MRAPLQVHVHGPGRAACSVMQAAEASGAAKLVGWSGGGALSAGAMAEHWPAVPGPGLPESPGPLDLVLIGVPDDALEAAAQDLAPRPWNPGVVFAHLSGARGAEALGSLAEAGHAVGGLHPLVSLPTRRSGGGLSGAFVAVAAQDGAHALLWTFALALQATPIELPPAARAAYHAGAALLANGSVALFDVAERLLATAGIDERAARSGLGALWRSVAEAVAQLGPAEGLTGPVVRGDAKTLDRHLEVLSGEFAPERALALELIRAQLALALRRSDAERSAPLGAWLEGHREELPADGERP